MEKVDVLVIGGSAAGLVAAMTAKSMHKEQRVMMIRKEEHVMIPCGIPYIFGSLQSSSENILPDAGLVNLGVEIVLDEVISLDKNNQQIVTKSGLDVTYDKLVLATGSKPLAPKWLKGQDLENVFVIPKNKVYLDQLKAQIEPLKHIVVVGAGFIGVELSDELVKAGKQVTLIEKESRILGMAFDDDVALEAEAVLKSRGTVIETGVSISEIRGTHKATHVYLSDNRSIDCEAVILSMGYVPNADLAQQAGIKLNEKGFIVVDEYMRTETANVFACGDCAEKRDFSTNKISTIMLASTACAEARVAGMNLYQVSTVRKFKGTIGIYSTNIGNSSFGVAGLTETMAKREGFNIISAKFQGIDRHPGKLNGAHKQIVKLIVSKECGRVLGGSVIGGASAGELTNVLGFIIQSGMTVHDLLVSQIGTQPMLTASPAAYPLIKAAELAFKQL